MDVLIEHISYLRKFCHRIYLSILHQETQSKWKQLQGTFLQNSPEGSRQSGLLLIRHQDTHAQRRTVWDLNLKGMKGASDALTALELGTFGTWCKTLWRTIAYITHEKPFRPNTSLSKEKGKLYFPNIPQATALCNTHCHTRPSSQNTNTNTGHIIWHLVHFLDDKLIDFYK